MTTEHSFGWIKDKEDERDLLYSDFHLSSDNLPYIVDLRDRCPPIRDQGNLGACTAFSLVFLMEFLTMKDFLYLINLSELFLYYIERVMENSVNSDDGAALRDGMKCLNKTGVCTENCWPYKISKFKTKPSASCYRQAAKHSAITYLRLKTITEMKNCLKDGFPFVCGIQVFESFEEVGIDGMVPMPTEKDRKLGGHAVGIVGYNDYKKCFIGRNSWSTDFAENGYFYIPYDYLRSPKLADDFWTIRKIKNEKDDTEPKKENIIQSIISELLFWIKGK
jgi:C1A family cysteine protease